VASDRASAMTGAIANLTCGPLVEVFTSWYISFVSPAAYPSWFPITDAYSSPIPDQDLENPLGVGWLKVFSHTLFGVYVVGVMVWAGLWLRAVGCYLG
jgi:hypothetical protein